MPAVMLALVTACCFLVGQPQVLYYIVLFSAFWAAGSLCVGSAVKQRAQCLAWGGASALLSAALCCIQLLPTLELVRDGLSQTYRGALDYASGYALDGGDILRLWLPNAFGNPFVGPASYAPGEHYHERVIYTGLLTPLLALFGLSRSAARRWQWGAAWLLVLAAAISLGDHTPLFSAFGKMLPGLLLFRCPGRIFCVATLLLALLAGRGLDAVIERHGRRRLSASIGVLVWAVTNILAYPVAKFLEGFDWHAYGRYTSLHLGAELAVQGILALDAIAVLAAGVLFGARHPRFITALFIAFGMADLGYNNVRNFFLTEPTVVGLPDGLPDGSGTRFVDAAAYPKLSLGALQYSKLVPSAIKERCATIGTNEGGVLPGRTMILYRALEKEPSRMLPLASCGYVYVRGTKRWELVEGALPRARFVSNTDDKAAGALLLSSLETPAPRLIENRTDAPLLVTRDEPCQVTIAIDTPSSGRLLLADIFYPGWRCTVDGASTPIEEAHGVFRAVPLGTGEHTVDFVYEPMSFRIGLAGTVMGIFLCAALLVAAWRRRRCLC